MKTVSDAVNGQAMPALPDKEADELHLNAFRTASLRRKLIEGRGWEGALTGLVREILARGEITGLPGWRRYRFQDTSTTFEFESFAEWITDPNGLGTSPTRLVELLEISPDEEGRALADQVRQELKLPVGSNQYAVEAGNNIPTLRAAAAEVRESERGTSAPGVRRRIRNWIQQNPTDANIEVAREWLATLEANPKSRLHQQALREIGIGKAKRVLDVSSVSEPLIERLYGLAKAEEMTVAQVLEDALAMYFRMDDEWDSPLDLATEAAPSPRAPDPAKVSRASNGTGTASKLQRIPEPGLYGASQLARAAGVSSRAITDAARTREDGGEVLTRTLADTPVMAVVRKANPQSERYEVLPR